MAKILIVDDSPTQMANLTGILQAHGHDTISADNGAAGISMAESDLPDLILMDVVMPELNGFQATRKISKNAATSHIPIILVTTKDQETDKVWGQRQGAKGYITKPPNERLLMEKVNELLAAATA